MMKRWMLWLLSAALLLNLAACGGSGGQKAGEDISAVAGDYYIDLSELGMKLTIYLRLREDATFQFSNTPSFEVNKSAGTVRGTDGEYLMVYTSVNGEERNVSDGLTSKFVRLEDGTLDFSVCDRIYYGSATATGSASDDPSIKLLAHVLPADYQAPSQESDFTRGSYAGAQKGSDGTEYASHISFFEDGSYFLFTSWTEGETLKMDSEVGRYGVSTTQLALTPQGENRVSCEVKGSTELSISVPLPNQAERAALDVVKTEDTEILAEFSGTGQKAEDAGTFPIQMQLYTDGSFSITADSFTEQGLFAPDLASGSYRIYPDHPTQGIRGANQVTTVPAGALSADENGVLTLEEFRVRSSQSLSRVKCTLVQE